MDIVRAQKFSLNVQLGAATKYDLLAIIVFTCVALCIAARILHQRRTPPNTTEREHHFNANVKPGKDNLTVSSSVPDPDPLPVFDLETATARNHLYVNKALRYPYFQTMAHQPMHINDWIEIDKEYRWYIDEKARVIQEQGKKVLDSMPENDEACGELLLTLAEYLPKRYPTLFKSLNSELGEDTGIWNLVTDEQFTDIGNLRGIDALRVVSRLVQDDFLMAREREDGHVYCVGGLVAFPGMYLISEKLDRAIDDLHDTVPHYHEMLARSIERTLKRFRPDQPFERTSWNVTDDRNLFWHNIASGAVPDQLHPKDLWLRVDHQTFRKLPKTQGIVFGVHPILRRMEDLADSPLLPALLERVHTDSKEELLTYKFAPKYREKLIPYLHELTQQQLSAGLISYKDLDRVKDFRDLVEADNIPKTQSTLMVPTESELLIRNLA